ncbi:hypothetical protein EP7_005562 (plasmid) [Isosphaeraceae bacterium EP7]
MNPTPSPGGSNSRAAIFSGLIVAFLGWCLLHYLDGLEDGTRDPRSVPLIFDVLYRIGGKWFASIAVMSVGGFVALAGLIHLLRGDVGEED